MKNQFLKPLLKNKSGFIAADFLFSFVLVIGCGMLIFLLTFSLAVVEISQYIVWSTARNYSSANQDPDAAIKQALLKFKNLSAQFPLLTGSNNPSPWFILDDPKVGDLSKNINDADFVAKLENDTENRDGAKQIRQPWIGARAYLHFKILEGVKMPFLGPILLEEKRGDFKFPIRAFILRHPSQSECQMFYKKENRFDLGIQRITGESFDQIQNIHGGNPTSSYVPLEDNGC